MVPSVTIGSVRGIPIAVHGSWLVVFVLFSIVFYQYFQRAYPGWTVQERWTLAVAANLMVFASVVGHELAHSLVALRRGVPVRGITLFIFGGVSHLEREAPKPSTELLVAPAGPLMSIVLGVALLGAAELLDPVSVHLSALAWLLGFVNVWLLGVFNLIPGFPMDGGRVLRATVWGITRNYRRATLLATFGGQAIGLGMVVLGAVVVVTDRSSLMSGIWLAILGAFLHTLAVASRRHSLNDEQEALPGEG